MNGETGWANARVKLHSSAFWSVWHQKILGLTPTFLLHHIFLKIFLNPECGPKCFRTKLFGPKFFWAQNAHVCLSICNYLGALIFVNQQFIVVKKLYELLISVCIYVIKRPFSLTSQFDVKEYQTVLKYCKYVNKVFQVCVFCQECCQAKPSPSSSSAGWL